MADCGMTVNVRIKKEIDILSAVSVFWLICFIVNFKAVLILFLSAENRTLIYYHC